MTSRNEIPARLRLARALQGKKQGEVAREARVDPSALSRYEKDGGDPAPVEVAERVFAVTDTPSAFTEVVVSSYRAIQGAKKAPGRTAADLEDALSAEVASRFAAMLAPALAVLSLPDEAPEAEERPPTAEDRAVAEALYRRLLPYSFEERFLVVSTGRQYRTAALCERLCDESENAAARDAGESLGWSKLALRVAERIPGSPAKRSKALGYAWAFVGNSRRIAGQSGIEEAFSRARNFYAKGRDEAPRWFEEARILDREASRRRDQGRYGEALVLHDLALGCSHDSFRARLLLNRAATLDQAGQPEKALAVLEEARPEIERGEGGPRSRLVLQGNTAKCLLQLYRASEAEALLPELRRLADELGNDLDRLRTRVLSGEILAALEMKDEALAELSAARGEFTGRKLYADAAVVGLHEAMILLEDCRTAKVRTLVRAMKPIFDSLGLKREALAGYRLFVAAVEQEAATATQARELAKAIERAGKRLNGPAGG